MGVVGGRSLQVALGSLEQCPRMSEDQLSTAVITEEDFKVCSL